MRAYLNNQQYPKLRILNLINPLVENRSSVIVVSVCVFARLSQKPRVQTAPKFGIHAAYAVFRSSPGSVDLISPHLVWVATQFAVAATNHIALTPIQTN